MFIKKSQHTIELKDVQFLNSPDDSIGIDQKTAEINYKNALTKLSETQVEADLETDGDGSHANVFDLEAEIKGHPDSLFVSVYAIAADVSNDNGDYFSSAELKKATSTFVGVPVFTNHQNNDIEQARGKVVHSWWDEGKNGIMIIARVDAKAYPDLARGIKEEYIAATSMGCLTEKCRVLMDNGTYLPISEVQPGDFVYTHLGNVKEVINTQIRPKKEFIKSIKFEGYQSTIEITRNHKVLTLKKHELCACGCGGELPSYKKGTHRSKSWKKKYKKRYLNGHSNNVWQWYSKSKGDLQSKEEMQAPRKFIMDDVQWVESGKLEIGDIVLFPIKKRKSRKSEDCTVGKARLLGYFLAEGCFARHKGKLYSTTFSFNLNEENTYVQEVIDLLKSEFPGCKPCKIRRTKSNVCLVVVRKSEIARWFYRCCGQYSSKKRISKKILNWPDEYLKHLVGTYINGDGCFSTRKYIPKSGSIIQNISVATVSHDLFSQIHFILTRMGIYTQCFSSFADDHSIEIKKAAGAESAVVVSRYFLGNRTHLNVRPVFSIGIKHSQMHKIFNYTGFDPSKIVKKSRNNDYLKFIDVYTNPKNKNPKMQFMARPIKCIEDYYFDGLVYNMEVKDDHSYIAEDMAVKNCQVQHSVCSICHNAASEPSDYCSHIKEQKTRHVAAKNQKCCYHKNGTEKKCPLCGSTKDNIKKYSVDQKAFEYNYGIKFIENSFVTSPAFSDCGVKEVINPQNFLEKAAIVSEKLPSLLKAASQNVYTCDCQKADEEEQKDPVFEFLTSAFKIAQELPPLLKVASEHDVICDDKKCVKYASQKELDDLNSALTLITEVAQAILKQREQVDMEFLSDIAAVLADLQQVTDELTEQGFGRLPSTEGETGQESGSPAASPGNVPGTPVANPAAAPTSITSGPAGAVGTVTGPMAKLKVPFVKVANKQVKIKPPLKKEQKIIFNLKK